MNNLLNGLKNATNYTVTENGALAYKTTNSALLDLFAMGAAMRNRDDEDCILMFKKAFAEEPSYALKCLFYLRDARGGQGERRFFRVCMKWLAQEYPEVVKRNIMAVPEMGRWDDLYIFIGTPVESVALAVMEQQFKLDMSCKTPSLLGKWLKSENTSSKESRKLATITREFFGMSSRDYRKSLSALRAKINIVETLMSQNRWDEIEFDKLPSRAGLIYRNAFARNEITAARYEAFINDKDTKVNAGTLYPYEVIAKVRNSIEDSFLLNGVSIDDVDRKALNKYWDNLTDYFNGTSLNALAVVDTSGSMRGTPLDVAISIGMYCAERAGGPFANRYISFSSRPQLIEVEGIDFYDKVKRIYKTNLCENTNIEATFDLILNTALKNHLKQEDLPENLIVISDMEFDMACHSYTHDIDVLMDGIANEWKRSGYKMPHLIFWNVDARQNNIPMMEGKVSFVSGFSPSIFTAILTGKDGWDLMMEVLNKERYAHIH